MKKTCQKGVVLQFPLRIVKVGLLEKIAKVNRDLKGVSLGLANSWANKIPGRRKGRS